jgi:hypothetical protein
MESKTISRKAKNLCLASALTFLWPASLSVALGQQSGSHHLIALGFAMREHGPISIVSVTSTREYMFERVIVKNMSEQHVSSVTFGVLLYPAGQPKPTPELVSGRSVPTTIGPGQERMIELYDFKLSGAIERMDRMKLTTLRAEIGVLAVEFEDGAPWNFDPLSHDGFVSAKSSENRTINRVTASKRCEDSPQMDERGLTTLPRIASLAAFHPSHQEGNSDAVPLGTFKCIDSSGACVYCTNNQTSCTITVCQMNAEGGCIWSNCAQQTWSYVQ